MKINSIKKIITEDFQEQKSWIGKLVSPLNQFMDSVSSALNNRLTINDNMSGLTKSILVDGTYPLKIAWPMSQKPTIVLVGNCKKVNGVHTPVTSAVYVDWSVSSDGSLSIDNVTGITASASDVYQITIVALTG